MAKVQVKISINKIVEVYCSGTNEEECLDDIVFNNLLDDFNIYEHMKFEGGEFDEPEEEKEL